LRSSGSLIRKNVVRPAGDGKQGSMTAARDIQLILGTAAPAVLNVDERQSDIFCHAQH
jgi:hypothetical protein